MNGFDEKEYQTVILAALLHDIGKFLQRRDAKAYQTSHEKTSVLFVEEFKENIQNDKLYDIELVKFLLRYHHKDENKNKILESGYKNNINSDKENIWGLLSIVNRADNYSCVEREKNEDEKRDGFAERLAGLDSIYSRINISDEKKDGNKLSYYKMGLLDPYTCFPDNSYELLSDNIISSQVKSFQDHLPDFSNMVSFSEVLNTWINYLLKYLWAVPSDTRYIHSDISLYDHLRTSSAIAACLYKYHVESLNNGKTKLMKKSEFYFIGGDFSGIQKYIFDITNIGSGGAAKRLRARSAFVFMFCEAAIHKILDALGLPYVCNLFSSGGKFLILAPCTEGVEEKLKTVKTEIEAEIHQTYFSQFSFLMSWNPINKYEKDFEVYKFYECANEMFWHLEREKLNKSATELIDHNHGWNQEAFKATELYKSYQGEYDCKICGKGPAIKSETPQEVEGLIQCENCYIDRNVIGQNIPRCKAIAFGKRLSEKKMPENRIILFHGEPEYYTELLKDNADLAVNEMHYLIYQFQNNISNNGKVLTRYYANHVPVDTESKTLDFTQIAAFPNNVIENQESNPSGMMGILKADIDNLGLIFNKGFEKPVDEEKHIAPPDRKTISRFLTLSRMTELFFSGWIQASMEKENHETNISILESLDGIKEKELWSKYLRSEVVDFTKIYTVYSGGDDLVLIGPWETMIVYAILLNVQFRKFTCNNPSITLSAGLAFVKPKFPVASGISQAEALLDASKEKGKNRITLFDTTVKWKQLPELIDYFLFLDDKLRDKKSGINKGFLYRLLKYHNMALDYFNNGKIEGLKFISALYYDIGRNIIDRDKDKKIIKGKEEFIKLTKLENIIENQAPIKNIKIPLFWTLYNARHHNFNTEESSDY